MFFNEGLTLKPGGVSVVLTNVGKGHTDGDIVVFIPEAEVLFASDLLYINSVGYMGNGYMTDWLLALSTSWSRSMPNRLSPAMDRSATVKMFTSSGSSFATS